MFVVWEPILPSDFMPPVTHVLRRISDPRAAHYWDREHVLAKRLARDARKPQPEPQCCTNDGILLDIGAVYPVGATWEALLPPAVVFDGPVTRIEGDIERVVANTPSR